MVVSGEFAGSQAPRPLERLGVVGDVAVVCPVGSLDVSGRRDGRPAEHLLQVRHHGLDLAHHGTSTGNGPTVPAHAPSCVTTAVTVRPTAPVWRQSPAHQSVIADAAAHMRRRMMNGR